VGSPCTRKEGIIEAIERERFRNEPQLRLTRTDEHEEDQPVAARKRKASGGVKTAQAQSTFYCSYRNKIF